MLLAEAVEETVILLRSPICAFWGTVASEVVDIGKVIKFVCKSIEWGWKYITCGSNDGIFGEREGSGER